MKRVVEVDGKFANRQKGEDKPDKADSLGEVRTSRTVLGEHCFSPVWAPEMIKSDQMSINYIISISNIVKDQHMEEPMVFFYATSHGPIIHPSVKPHRQAGTAYPENQVYRGDPRREELADPGEMADGDPGDCGGFGIHLSDCRGFGIHLGEKSKRDNMGENWGVHVPF